jgi:RNA polymerase sigma-70 factor (ECF subfamily)
MSLPENHLRAHAGARDFATTQWSLVSRAREVSSAQTGEALEKLCQAYWYPLYAFVRREGYGPEEAQDLTQEFFSRLLAKNYLQMADRNRGRFRSFLLASMKHMLANERRAAARQKRGGDTVVFSLDAQNPEERYRLEPADPLTPDRIFEKRWAEATLARVLDRLEIEYSGHVMRFEQLKVFLIEAKGAVSFAEVSEGLGVTQLALKSVVHRMRRRYGQLFREEIAHTVACPADVEDEIRQLLGALST